MQYLNVIRTRLLFLALVVVGVSMIAIAHLIPGDPAMLVAGDRATPEIVERVREDMGLNKPLPEQYWIYLKGILSGDLGTSLRTRRPVAEDLKLYFPATMELALVALMLATTVGVPLGVASAVWRAR